MNIEQNPIYQDFMIAEHMLRALFEDRDPPGLLLYGPPGVGKSFIVKRLYKEYLNYDAEPMDGSARGILEYIFEHRDDVLVFDDTDKMFYDPALMALFKKLLDTNEPRIIAHRVRGENELPPFQVTAAVIVITNRNFDNPSNFGRTFYQTYIRPFRSRLAGSIFKITDSPRDVLDYTLHLAPDILRTVGLTKRSSGLHRKLAPAQQDEIFDHFLDHHHAYPEISPRMVYLLGKARLNITDDRMWVRYRQKILDDARRQRQRHDAEFDNLKEKAELTVAHIR